MGLRRDRSIRQPGRQRGRKLGTTSSEALDEGFRENLTFKTRTLGASENDGSQQCFEVGPQNALDSTNPCVFEELGRLEDVLGQAGSQRFDRDVDT